MKAVITGATKGIGKSIALIFSREGFDIATCARNEEGLNDLRKEILAASPQCEVLTKVCDVSVKEDIQGFANMVNEQWESVDVLVNNAGFFIQGQISKEDDGIMEKMMATNLYGPYHLTRMLIDKMIHQRSGYIFNICSTASITPYVNGGSYCISKYALLGFSKVLREELRPHNIRVSSVLPGATLTNLWDHAGLPEDRFIQPDDIASILFNAYQLNEHTVMEEILIRPLQGDID